MKAIEGRVRGLAKDGDAVVETERGLVFAPGGLPGERVRVEDVRKEGKLLRARRLVVLEPSSSRVEPACVHVARCGGCPWMHGSAEAQAEAKRATVERALAKVPRASSEVSIAITQPAAMLGYRGRARLAWRGGALGLRARRDERIVDVERCIVLRPELDAALALLRARLRPHLPGSGEMQLAIGAGGRAVIVIETDAVLPRAAFAEVEAMVAEGALAGASVRAGGASVATRIGDPREVGRDVEGRVIHGAIGGFSQAHDEINAALGARVIAWAEPEGARVLELYCGHGNLTLALASRAASVRAVELSSGATEALRENLAAHDLRAEVITADALAGVPTGKKERVDVVVLDPPRTGAKEVIDPIAALRPSRIVYVSCDPATLGRDLERLATHGYVLARVEAFDMFPQTAHVETVALVIPRPSS
ncbi:class I SAM-dependent RNA methyltransferase [Sandaracinus amylolyticus]|uniref:class I SAM-dependent RNA methyltransferase n=1 Tax=Sandaracinus amylolyticus TaxID=927083 RepID=UPI001F348612|nr:RsmD family RNA methyltransferase [Sandaracinus amylolyticus]UJR80469.1 23S rRNA (Uracil-5-)-methyltransferase RumA [Sandaracinus amylolyticus]